MRHSNAMRELWKARYRSMSRNPCKRTSRGSRRSFARLPKLTEQSTERFGKRLKRNIPTRVAERKATNDYEAPNNICDHPGLPGRKCGGKQAQACVR